ncbi:hypothetical protein CLIB1444_09S01618 [[Candida] jaroonii]|uniref:Uncharacterized protein n=1 Tax=[Candida] jaroonii TaxID=467808 RepID=A0ACA9YD08_9ASCO|nr:hypothetical protein CLIB1444_09S01618 [[Candida] jaroonii]
MIKQLQQDNQNRLSKINDEINEYHDSISSFSIIEDENFKNSLNDKSSNSLTSLNENLKKYELQMKNLNDLWVVKGLIQEIEGVLHPDVDSTDLESLIVNVNKLKNKLASLNDNLLIKNELLMKYEELMNEISSLISTLFYKFLPSAREFHQVVNDIQFDQFMKIIDELNEYSEKINLNDLVNDYKITWENILLKINKTNHLDESLEFHEGESSLDSFFQSIINFTKFINMINLSSLKNLYQLKLSNKLINFISENIDSLINSPNENLVKIIKDLNETHWNLSIELNLSNMKEKLNSVYQNWLMENYIDKIRSKFKSYDLKDTQLNEIKINIDKTRLAQMEERLSMMDQKLDRAMSEERGDEDGWDQGWGDKEDPDGTLNDTIDGDWNEDGWDEWDKEEQPSKGPTKSEPKTEESKNNEDDQWDSWEKEESTGDNKADEDGWDDGWNEWDDPEQKEAQAGPVKQSQPKANVASASAASQNMSTTTTIKISSLPNELMEILNDFQIESTQEIDLLVSTILSISSISYPPINQSFLQYNDLQFLGKNMGHRLFNRYSEMLIKQLQNQIFHELSQILQKLNIDDETSNQAIFDNLSNWYNDLFKNDLSFTNFLKFKEIVHNSIDYICNFCVKLILKSNEITEFRSSKLTDIIQNFKRTFMERLSQLKETEQPESLNKLLNFEYLINSHLVEIIEKFYSGDFYNLSTDELVATIQLCFVKSDLRDNYINEIIEFRNIT